MPPALSDSRKTGKVALLERGDHRLALADGDAAVQEPVLDAAPGQVRREEAAHLDVLREDQHGAVLGEHRAEELVDEVELLGAAGQPDGAGLLEEVGRVVADLLEAGEQGEHQPAAGDLVGRVGALDALHRVLDERLVEDDLLAGQPERVVGLGLGRAAPGAMPGSDLRRRRTNGADQLGELPGDGRVDAAPRSARPSACGTRAGCRAGRASPSRGSPTARSGCSRPACRSSRRGRRAGSRAARGPWTTGRS